jgi:hypothetical protein
MQKDVGTFLVIMGFISFIVIPIFNYCRANKVKAGRVSVPALDDAQIESMFDRKQGDITYNGYGQIELIDDQAKNFHLVKMKVRFALVRNIAAMTHREREALRFFCS